MNKNVTESRHLQHSLAGERTETETLFLVIRRTKYDTLTVELFNLRSNNVTFIRIFLLSFVYSLEPTQNTKKMVLLKLI